ncbi:MAG: serine protease [Planctomycetota bacterium]
MRHRLQPTGYLRTATTIGVLSVALGVAAQCGPSGCYVRPRPPASTTIALPAELRGTLARIVHNEGPATSLGSGALIATIERRSYFLTCAHLFESAGQTSIGHQGRTLRARVVAIDRQHDLALLETQRVAGTVAQPAAEAAGGQLTACGFGPTGQLRCIQGPIVGQATAVGASAPSLRIRGAVRSGDSGGPVFNAAGRLVAVIWGERGGETFAMGGSPLRRILSRIPRTNRDPPPVDRTPLAGSAPEASDPWRDRIEQRLDILDSRRPSQPTLPNDLVRQNDLDALASRWDQRFDRLSTQVRVGVETPSDARRDSLLTPAITALLAALGVGGPIGIGLFFAKAWLRRRQRRRRATGSRTEVSAGEEPSERTIVVDTPPPPQRVVSETHYVPYQRDDFARAHQWASEQLVRKFPGSVEMLASLDSLIKQQLNGDQSSVASRQ